MRKTKASVEKTTAEIVSTALDIFSKKGYAATNLQHIADALGITRTPLYYHFKKKLQLYEQVVEDYLRSKEQDFISIFYSSDDIFEKTRRHLVKCCYYGTIEEALFMGIEDLGELEYVRKIRRKTADFIYSSKQKVVEEAIKNGELRNDTNPVEFVDHSYVLHFGFMGMAAVSNFMYANGLGEDLKMRLIDTTVQGMMLKYKLGEPGESGSAAGGA